MDLNITGDPGTHNTYNEVNIHIDHVENFNPNATTVVNNYGTQSPAVPSPSPSASSPSSQATMPDGFPSVSSPSTTSALIERQRDDILTYVQRLIRVVAGDYVTRYEPLWRDILDIPEVAAEVYNPGKQQHTTFNRNLVAGIIGMMKNEGIITETNVTRLTELLEGDKEHSVRNAIATPPSRVIINKVRARIEALKTSS